MRLLSFLPNNIAYKKISTQYINGGCDVMKKLAPRKKKSIWNIAYEHSLSLGLQRPGKIVDFFRAAAHNAGFILNNAPTY